MKEFEALKKLVSELTSVVINDGTTKLFDIDTYDMYDEYTITLGSLSDEVYEISADEIESVNDRVVKLKNATLTFLTK